MRNGWSSFGYLMRLVNGARDRKCCMISDRGFAGCSVRHGGCRVRPGFALASVEFEERGGMRVTECPHCFVEVVAAADGQCPNCQKNVNSVDAASSQRTTVLITPESSFPAHCHLCNAPTKRVHSIVEWTAELVYEDDRFPALRWLLAAGTFVLLPFFWIMMGKVGGDRRAHNKTVLRVPTCPACNHPDIRVVESIAERNEFRIAVNKDFVQQCRLDARGVVVS